jgi:hypothetical protein
MLKMLTDLSDNVKAQQAQQKTIVEASNEVIAGLRLKVAALELAAIPEADFSPELAKIAEIESLVASISAPPVADPVVAPVVAPPVVAPPVVAPVVAPPVVVPPVVPPVV